jgi:hypothetical protein
MWPSHQIVPCPYELEDFSAGNAIGEEVLGVLSTGDAKGARWVNLHTPSSQGFCRRDFLMHCHPTEHLDICSTFAFHNYPIWNGV